MIIVTSYSAEYSNRFSMAKLLLKDQFNTKNLLANCAANDGSESIYQSRAHGRPSVFHDHVYT